MTLRGKDIDRDNITTRIANLPPEKRALLERKLKEKNLDSLLKGAIPRRPQQDPALLSFSQQRLWFLDQYDPGSAVYNIPKAVRITGVLDLAALEQSLREIVRRHEVLRTTFSMSGEEPIQVITPSLNYSLPVVDLRDLPENEREYEARRVATKEARRPFDLVRGPLFRTTLLRLGEEDHVLLLTLHHIVSDGWSMGVLYRELSVLYEALSKAQQSPLTELPIQYADYAMWQRGWLRGEVLERQLSYWKRQLNGVSTLQLPTDRPRPAVQTFRGQSEQKYLSKELSDGLKALSRREGVTLFMTLLAGFQTLLYRYTGQEDIVVGAPIANRNRREIEGLIGFFVNTLILRTDVSGNPSFRELLRRVREIALGAYGHQDLPFEKLVEELQPERNLSHSPLFQVMFALQNAPSTALQLEGLSVSPVRIGGETAKFDLTLLMHEEAGRLSVSLHYRVDLFDEATMARMVGHFQTLLEGIVADPEQRLSELALLTESEKHQLLVEWNDTKRDYPADKCIQELFEQQVEKTPEAMAVICGDQQLSYRELNTRANQLSHYLRKLGVRPEILVGICVERSLEMVVALLGILKAGGVYVPLDPEYPKDRLAFILEDTQSKVLLTQERLLERLPEHSKTVCLDRDWKKIVEERAENPISGAASESSAYVIYTSGSTGKPKGVAIRQQGIIRLVVNPSYVTLSPADTIAQASNFAFDAATFEIWGALVNGARLAIIAKEWVLSPERLAQAFVSYRVTCVFLTTAVFNRVSSEKPDAFRDLRYLLFGGETCDPDRVKAVLESGPPEHLVHVYGPTETTTFATFHEVTRVISDRTIPIGRPITATEVILLDPRSQLVPCGVVGEICIGGPGVAAGYINRPQETKAHFVPHPFRPETGERVYRTGDLARWLPDGNVEFVGRSDDQVKIRGFRIEPAEVSAVLNSHPAVRESRVMARQQISGEMGLTAYFVPLEGGNRPTPSELRRFLLTRLPNYMVPVSFVALETIPLTPNGKLDYRALPAPRSQDTQEKNEYVRPRDETERVLCRLWSEVLGLERVGIDDDFFALGGHSLLAAKLFTRLDEAFGRSFPLGILFTAPTVRLLAESYRNSAAPKAPSVIVPLREGGILAPIYAVPGVFGNVVGFEDLTRELCSEHPFYGLQSLGLDGAEAPLDSIESMADVYVREIRKVQPKGPYALIGACFGATVAYEMARQLLERGEEVAFLGLLDPTRREGNNANGNHTHVPHLIKRTMALVSILRDRLQLYKEEMRGLQVKDRFKFAARKIRSFGRSLGNNHGFKGVERELHQLEVYRANILALDRYHRKPLKGRLRALEIFETARLRNSRLQEKLDWSVLWGGEPIRHPVSGKDSGDMVSRKHAHALATLLAERLRAAFGDASDARREGLLDADKAVVTPTK